MLRLTVGLFLIAVLVISFAAGRRLLAGTHSGREPAAQPEDRVGPSAEENAPGSEPALPGLASSPSPQRPVVLDPDSRIQELSEFDRLVVDPETTEAASVTRSALVMAAGAALREEPGCFAKLPEGPSVPVFRWDVEVGKSEIEVRAVRLLEVTSGAPVPDELVSCVTERLTRLGTVPGPPGGKLLDGYRGVLDLRLPLNPQDAEESPR